MSIKFSLIVAPIFLIIIFLLCLLWVYLIKSFILKFIKKPTESNEKPVRKKRKKIKSIEINPDDVDRIYVRKS